ncbi:MAG: ATP phosphoribosyltransferase regulatory subunit, partial [Pseudomonadota bacterium]
MTIGPGSAFKRIGGTMVDPSIVLPANLPLELSGEVVRARLCVFTDHQNRDMALRPDLTLPVALDEVEARRAGAEGIRVAQYAARAFRMPASVGDPIEFVQIGCERFGDEGGPAVDADTFALVAEEAAAAGLKTAHTRLGDLGVFQAFVDALDLSVATKAALKRAFREVGGIGALLDRETLPSSGMAKRLKGMDRGDARQIVDDMIEVGGLSLVGTRTADEIVERLLETANAGDIADISEEARTVLEAVRQFEAAPAEAVDGLAKIARQAGLEGIDDAFHALENR